MYNKDVYEENLSFSDILQKQIKLPSTMLDDMYKQSISFSDTFQKQIKLA